MVHYKYTKRDGKVYGPYAYECKRINGKIVTNYLGKGDNSKKLLALNSAWKLIVFLAIFLVLLQLFILFQSNFFTARVGLELEPIYTPGETLAGNLKFNLKEGELIPKDVRIKVSYGNEIKEIALSELVNGGSVSGEFFAEGVGISGSGGGYGVAGKKEGFPEVEFELRIFSDIIEIPIETPAETPSASPSETPASETSEMPAETPAETPTEELAPEESNSESAGEEAGSSGAESSVEESAGEVIEESAITGGAIAESETIVSGKVKKGEVFSENLNEGENVELVSGSVKADGSAISDNEIKLEVKDGKVEATTDYKIDEEGFGEEYLGKKGLELEIELEKFGINVTESGKLKIELVYNEIVIVSAEEEINVLGKEKDKEEKEKEKEEIIEEINESEIIVNETEINITEVNVTIANESLIGVVGNVSVNISTIQFGARLGEPVKWKKKIDVNGSAHIIIEIPASAGNVSIIKIRKSEEELAEESAENIGNSDENIVENTTETVNETINNENEGVGENDSIIIENEIDNMNEDNINLSYKLENNKMGSNGEVEPNLSDNSLPQVYNNGNSKYLNVSVDSNKSARVAERLTRLSEKQFPSTRSEGSNPFPGAVNSNKLESRDQEIKVDIHGNVIHGRVSAEIELSKEPKIVSWFKRLFRLTGFAVSNESISEDVKEIAVEINSSEKGVEIEYETPAPYAIEESISNGKRVKIIGPDALRYENVLSWTELNESFNIRNPSRIKLYWRENNTYVTPSTINDLDGNGIYDYVEWVTPHLSNQTFDIILITKAEHLDENRTFVEDVYGAVKERDGNFTEIPAGDYVRVVFERNLTSDKDITIYARSNYNGGVSVYEKDKNELIADFGEISEDKMYKVYLSNLTGEQDVFDLLVKGGNVEFDYIVDPSVASNDTGSVQNNITCEAYPFCHITLNDSSLILYLPFDVNHTFANISYDYSPAKNHITTINNSIWNQTGLYGGAYEFAPTGGTHLKIPSFNISGSNGGNLTTIMFWVYGKGLGEANSGYIFVFNTWYSVYFESSNGLTIVGGFTTTTGTFRNAIFGILNQWSHIAIVYNRSSTTNIPALYKNGINVSLTTLSIPVGSSQQLNSQPLWIGSNNAFNRETNMTLDEFMVFDRLLSSDEISAIFNNQSYRFRTPATQLFENVSVAQDGSINKVNITTNATLNFGTNISLRLRQFNSSNANIANTSWVNISDGENQVSSFDISISTYNLTLEFNYLSDANNFYSPILRDWIASTEYAKPLIVTINFPIANAIYGINNLPLNFNVSLNENGSVQYSLDGGRNNISMSGDQGWFGTSFNASNSSIGTGSYTFSVYANDTAGNWNRTTSRTFSYDGTAPNISFVSPTPANNSLLAGASIYVNISTADENEHYAFADFDDSLVLWTRMDDMVNATLTKDLSKYGNNGTLVGGAIINSTGRFGNASWFDGVNDRIDISDSPSLSSMNNSGQFTIGAWIYKRQLSALKGITGSNRLRFVVRGATNGIAVYLYNSSGDSYLVWRDDVITVNNWYFVSTTYNRLTGNLTIYLNGSVIQSSFVPDADLDHTSNFPIGESYNWGDFFNGSIDEVLIFNRSLSAAEIQALYNASANKYYNNFTGLADGSHTFKGYAVDVAGNKNETELRQVTTDGVKPGVSFVAPTLANGTSTTNTSIEINVSIVETQLGNVTFNWNGTSTTIYDSSLVLYMNFENLSALGENDTHVKDISRYGNNATIYGNATINSTCGRYGSGICFRGNISQSGSNEFIQINNINYETTEATFSFWIISHNTTNPSYEGIIFPSGSAKNPSIYIQSPQTTPVFRIYIANTTGGTTLDYQSPTGLVIYETWAHYVVSYNSSGVYLYKDGRYIGGDTSFSRGTDIANIGNDTLYFGRHNGGDRYLNGSIDEVLIFNRSLSAAEIQQLYFMNLYKYNNSGYVLYVNQSKNSTAGLGVGAYTYYASVRDVAGNENVTETRTVNITAALGGDNEYPLFSNYWDNNASLTGSGIAQFNVTIVSTNGTVRLEINGTNYTALNTTGNVFNVSISLSNGTYSYYWLAWGNGTNKNYNTSGIRYYTINSDTTAPIVTINMPANTTYTILPILFNVGLNENGSVQYSLDGGINNISMVMNASGTGFTASNNSIASGGYVFRVYANDSLGNMNNTASVSFGVNIAAGTTTTTTTSGGGGGGGVTTTKKEKKGKPEIEIDKDDLSISVVSGTEEKRSVKIKNVGNESVEFSVEIIGEELRKAINVDDLLEIGAGEDADLDFKVNASDKGLLAGKIVLSSGDYKREIFVIVNVRTEDFLFDVLIAVPKELKILDSGESLFAQVNLLQVGVNEKVDVTANYIIKDYIGNVFLDEKETFYVLGAKDYEKEFSTIGLPPGKYIVGLEISYPNAFATSSSQFEIKEKKVFDNKYFAAGIAITVFAVAMIGVMIWRIMFWKRRKVRFIQLWKWLLSKERLSGLLSGEKGRGK